MKHKNSFAVLPYGYFNLIVRETLGGGGEGGEKKERRKKEEIVLRALILYRP